MIFKPETWTDDRRVKHPGRFLKIDYGNSPTGAITEFCRQCEQIRLKDPDGTRAAAFRERMHGEEDEEGEDTDEPRT